MWTMYEKEIQELFEELVPPCGQAECVAGEIVRAVNRIIYRYFNDGDRIDVGYGKETCNAAARYLLKHGDEAVENAINQLWGEWDDNKYEDLLDDLGEAMLNMLQNHPELRQEETEDMFSFFDSEADRDDTYDDEEDDDEYYDYEEDEEDCYDDGGED